MKKPRPIFLGFLMLIVFCSFICVHAIKISTSEIVYSNSILKIKIKLFADDLGASLSQITKKEVQFDGLAVDAATMKVLDAYIKGNFSIAINNSEVELLHKKTVMEEDLSAGTKVVWLYYIVENVSEKNIKEMEIKNTLLFGAIPEQKNICTVKLHSNENGEIILFENQNNDKIKKILINTKK